MHTNINLAHHLEQFRVKHQSQEYLVVKMGQGSLYEPMTFNPQLPNAQKKDTMKACREEKLKVLRSSR